MPYYHSDCSIINRITPIPTPEDIVKNRALDISANTKILQWETAEEFMNTINGYVPKKDESDNLTSYTQETRLYLNNMVLNDREKTLSSEDASDYTGSNANWGRVTQREQIGGQTLVAETPHSAGSIDYQYQESTKCNHCSKYFAPDLNVFSPEGYDASCCNVCNAGITIEITDWCCKGCLRYFTTKASLKRHLDRKKSCKEICEKEDISGSRIEVPEKPYVVDWVDELLKKAISGAGVESPFCQFCEVEFANKSNLNKHLNKSVACDKLAKEEFIKMLKA